MWIDDDPVITLRTTYAKVLNPFHLSAFALPVADCVIDKLQCANVPVIRDRKHAIEYSLQTSVFPFARHQIHLKKFVIGLFLNFDQIRNLESLGNLGKTLTF